VANFEIPESLSDLTPDELEELRETALAEFDELNDSSPRTAQTVARMREIREGLDTIRGEFDARAAIEAEAEELASAVRAEFAEDDDEGGDEEGDDAGEEEAGDDTPAPEAEGDDVPVEEVPVDDAPAPDPDPDLVEPIAEAPVDEPAPEAPPTPPSSEDTIAEVDDDTMPTDEDDEDAASSIQQEPVPVAASASPPAVSATALNAHRGQDAETPSTPPRAPATIVAAANLPDRAPGEPLTMADVATALRSRLETFPKRGKGQMRAGVAIINKPFSDDLRAKEGEVSSPYFDRAANEAALPGGSLVAAGGWCAPSETIYDLCTMESTDGMVSLPSITVGRGGLRHTTGPDFRAIYDSTGFHFTEQDDIDEDWDGDGGDKPCAVIPCPEFSEQRLEVTGLCVTGGILQDVAYPEVTQRFTEGALIGHAHRVNSLKIDKLVSGSDAVSPTSFGSATTSILSAVELVGEDMKYRNRMSRASSLEAIFPFWTLGVMRADLSNRLGVELLSVTDSMLTSWMRDRNINPQFVYDWQDDLADGASGFGSAVAQDAWPNTVDFLIFPAGTWVIGEQDVITIDAIYDSVNLPKNNYLALFMEDAWQAYKRCHDSRIVTVADYNCFGDAAAGTACPSD
jgi:hypothetical protein